VDRRRLNGLVPSLLGMGLYALTATRIWRSMVPTVVGGGDLVATLILGLVPFVLVAIGLHMASSSRISRRAWLLGITSLGLLLVFGLLAEDWSRAILAPHGLGCLLAVAVMLRTRPIGSP
jgi:hypothetical protein